MAATTVATLASRTRRFIRDYPDNDVLGASLSAAATTITVGDSATKIADNWTLEIDSEVMVATSTAASGTTVNVRRAARGTTAATHVNGSVILVRPRFFTVEILDAFNAALEAMYPYIYKAVVDETTLNATAQTYEYTIPTMPSDTDVRIYHLSEVSIQETGDERFYPRKDWDVIRGATPTLRFRHGTDTAGDIRLYGYGPFPRLTLAGSLDVMFPRQAEELFVLYAGAYLMAGKEMESEGRAKMSNSDALAQIFNNPMRASDALFRRFAARLQNAAMPALPRHVKSVI